MDNTSPKTSKLVTGDGRTHVDSGLMRESLVSTRLLAATDGGTNGLLLRPPTIIGPAYGPDSAKRHEDAARRSDARVIILRSPHWLLDLDTPEQFGRLRALATERAGAESLHTLQCLRDADFPAVTDA